MNRTIMMWLFCYSCKNKLVTHLKLKNDLFNINLPGWQLWNSCSLCALKPEGCVTFSHHFNGMFGLSCNTGNTKSISWPFHVKTSSSTWISLLAWGSSPCYSVSTIGKSPVSASGKHIIILASVFIIAFFFFLWLRTRRNTFYYI